MRLALLAFLAAACGVPCPPGQHVEEQNCHEHTVMVCVRFGKYGCEFQMPVTSTVCDSVCVGPVWAEDERDGGVWRP